MATQLALYQCLYSHTHAPLAVLLGVLLPSFVFFVVIDMCWIALVAGAAFQQVNTVNLYSLYVRSSMM